MKSRTTLIERIGIVALIIVIIHLLGSAWWAFDITSKGYTYQSYWAILVDNLTGEFYVSLGLVGGFIAHFFGASCFVVIAILAATVIFIIISFFYWLATGKHLGCEGYKIGVDDVEKYGDEEEEEE